MDDQLASSGNGGREAETPDDVVQARLEGCDQVHTGRALAAGRLRHVPLELLLKHAVVEAQLLLFLQAGLVVRVLPATAHAVLARGVRTLEGSDGGEAGEDRAECAADLHPRAGVAGHRDFLGSVEDEK